MYETLDRICILFKMVLNQKQRRYSADLETGESLKWKVLMRYSKSKLLMKQQFLTLIKFRNSKVHIRKYNSASEYE
jgi:hypothetical protein